MKDIKLYERLLGIEAPWRVRDVHLRLQEGVVEVFVESGDEQHPCPQCQRRYRCYDHRQRRWRHLDTMQYRTWLVAEVPRVECPEHGVRQVDVPWADKGARFTAMFEALVIDWLKEASFSAVARRLRLSWDEVAGIQDRAVQRGLRRRAMQQPTSIGVDETSFRKGHEYVTIVSDLERQRVLHVAEGRDRSALDGYFAALGDGCAAIETVAMDMWRPYINATETHTDAAIVFDKFHIAKHLGDAVDQVRRREQRELAREGDHRLKGSKYAWLSNPRTMSSRQRRAFAPLRTSKLRVARAWAIKEMAMTLWNYRRRGWAEKMWKRWYGWAIRSRLEPIKRVARMIKRHWDGVMNAVTSNVTNARAEGVNARIQWIKRMGCGFRNRQRFRNAIYFHLGGLDLYPGTLATHTNS